MSSGGNTLTQGFHQPEIHFSSIENNDHAIYFWPLPQSTEQFVTIVSANETAIQVHVYDASDKQSK